MQVINIIEPELPNEIIYDTINLILKSDNIDEVDLSEPSKKGINIGELMVMGITDKNLLNSIVEILKNHGYYTSNEEFQKVMIELVNKPEIDADLAVRIKSIRYGILLKHESFLKMLDCPENKYLPKLETEINRTWVKSNLDEILDEAKGGKIKNIKNELEKLPLDIRIIKYKEVLRIMGEISVDYNTDELKKHFDRLTSIKENLPDEIPPPLSNEDKKHEKTIWFRLGVLFAQEKIIQKGFDYFYEGTEFKSERSISFHIGKNILNLKKPYSVRPFLHDTLKDTDSDKNIYTSFRINKIYEYCKNNNIQMCDLFILMQKNPKRY